MQNIKSKIPKLIKISCFIICIIIAISIGAIVFAKSNIFNNSKEKNINLELAMVDNNKPKSKLTRDGNTNIGNGGNGGDYDGASDGYSILGNEQDEGVRVTLVESKTNTPVTSPIDFANNPRQPIQKYLGGGNKLYYIKNQQISFCDGKEYTWQIPDFKLPKIIGGNLASIKKYFGSEVFLKYFSELTGFNYEEMTSGKYKLMLEPIGYPKIAGKIIACTATELAILDKKLNGSIKKKLADFSHLNLPMAMFLEHDEFGIKKWTGSTVTRQKNDIIIAQLGVGAVTFTPEEPEEPEIVPQSYEYRTNTDVYTSIEISGVNCLLSFKNKEVKNPVYVTFVIDDKSYPADNNGLVFQGKGIAYIKWHTPDTPQDMIIKVNVSYNIVDYTKEGNPYLKRITQNYDIPVKIVEIEEKTPPNPDADDKNKNFSLKEPEPIEEDNKELTWTEYDVNQESMVLPNGKDVITKWIWTTYEYKAYLGTFLNVYPDPLCKTFSEENYDLYHDSTTNIHIQRMLYKLKSGYGIRQKIESKLLVEKTTKVTHIDGTFEEFTDIVADVGVAPQNAINYFSDFDFKDYFRLSEVTELNNTNSIMEFKKNPYSTYENRTHFTPIWYPDNEFYIINSMIFDSWTPAGQLYIGAQTTNGASVNDKMAGNAIFIKGNLWDDWYVQSLPTYSTNPREANIN